jgi:ATP-dependent RNA helicase HelY
MTDRTGLLSGYDFPLDPFQIRAIDALDGGRSVLVAAPTGSGKTLVAEYAVATALATGGKAFYTAPIKALSNQKYADLARRHGAHNVGLLTGDNAINPHAPVVVMTTEVLRNMVYAGSDALVGLRFVVLDEVHYLQDAYRGPVWEEVIIHLAADVRPVCLSATVSNAEELAEWISTVRGPTEAVIEERRPVELQNLYLVGDKSSQELHLLPTLVDGRPNPEADRLDDEALHVRRSPRGRPRRRFFTPRRVEVIERLRDEDMLPAITFIFSRNACDEARDACLDAGLRLTTADERARIRQIVDERTASLADADLEVLRFDRFLGGLEAGVAAHHAGMVPPFKEAVEACFTEGLTKAVFATETLALGVNMPARTVVIERLTKFTGERRELLTAGEYTQLTGRAGRRGIDEVGHAIVLWSPFVPFEQVAGLASSRTYALRSAFRPTYNMAANLVRRYQPEQAHHLLNLSFAQYQADRDVVRLETRLERQQERLDRLRAEATCEQGDIEEYRALRAEADRARRDRGGRSAGPDSVSAAVGALSPVDVVIHHGRRVAVLSVALRKGQPRLRGIDEHQATLTLGPADFEDPPEVAGTIRLPMPYAPNTKTFRREVVDLLRRAAVADTGRHSPAVGRRDRSAEPLDEVDAAVLAVTTHPVDDCPDRDAHVRSAAQADRVERELTDLRRQVRSRTESLARRFDRVLRLLETWGYLEGWSLTEAGAVLAGTYHESDLLVAEALTSQLLDDLDAPSLAAVVSCLTYEHRGRDRPPAPQFPSSTVRERFRELERIASALVVDEEDAGLPPTRLPDPGFVHLAHAWADGRGLAALLEDEQLSGGDFVRNVKQLIDLLRGIAKVAPVAATAARAGQAADALLRGVVTATSVFDVDDDEEPPPPPVPRPEGLQGADPEG